MFLIDERRPVFTDDINSKTMYDINKVREDFPILAREVYGKPLVYLDNAATTQKPLCVLDAMREEYLNVNANVHRGVHYLSQQATDLHEAAREKVRGFINAEKTEEIVFTRGTTEAVNLLAKSDAGGRRGAGNRYGASFEHRPLAVAGDETWHRGQAPAHYR